MSKSPAPFTLRPLSFAIITALLPSIAVGAPVNWVPDADGFWDVVANWSSAPALPGAPDDVTLDVAGTRTITYRQNVNTINSLTINSGETLAVTGGTLNTGTLANTSIVNVSGGSFNVGSGNSGTMNLSGGTLGLSGTLNATGVIRMTGGQITGGTVQQSAGNTLLFTSSSGNTLNGVTVRGTLTVGDAANPSGRVRISNGLVVQTEGGGAPGVVNVGTVAGATSAILGFTGTQTFDNGTINLGSAAQSGDISLDGAGTFTLGANGIVRGNGSFGQARFVGGTANIVNAGLVSADLSGRTLTVNNSGGLTNDGTLEARNGSVLTLSSGGASTNNGLIEARTGSTVNINAGSWTNVGILRLFDATSTLNLGGTFTLAALGTLDNTAGGNLNLTGTLLNTGGTLSLASPVGSLRMVSGQITGGTVQQSAGNTLLFTSSSGNTLNGVTVRGTLTVGDAANPSGRVRISNGLVVQTEGGGAPGVVNVGTVAGATSAILGFTGTQTFDNGTINLGSAAQSGDISLDGAGTFTLGANGIVRGNGSFGQARFVGGTANIVNAGLVSADLSGRTLTVNNSGGLTNDGTLEARNGSVLTLSSGGASTNNGLIEARTGSTVNINAGSWTNVGILRLFDATSTLNLGGTFTLAALGTLDNTAGGNLNLTGTLLNTGGTLSLASPVGSLRMVSGQITGGTVQQSAGNTLLFTSSSGNTLNGVTVRGTLTVGDAANPSGRVRISNGLVVQTEGGGAPGVVNVGTVAGATSAILGFTGTQTFDNGTINLGSAAQSGDISLDGAGTFTLGANGIVRGNGSFGQARFVGGTANIVNAGLVSADLSGRTLTVNNSGGLTNDGTLEARNGSVLTLSSGGASTNNGLIEARTGSTVNINAGSWTNVGILRLFDATSTLNLGGTFTLAALGTLDNTAGGNLNLTGTLLNTGGTLSLAAPVGSLRMVSGQITGGTVQQSAGNTLLFTSSSGNTLNGVTVRGTLTVGDAANPSGRVRISNGLVVQTEGGGAPGVVNVGTVAGATSAILGFTGTQTFDNGTINLGSAAQSGDISLDGAGTFTLGANGIVRGNGSFGQARFVGGTANIVNAGLVSADLSGRTLTVNNSGGLTNDGTLEARNGSVLTLSSGGASTNNGLIEARTGSTVNINAGSWTNVGILRLFDATSTLNLGGSFTLAALGTLDNTAGGNLNLTGTLLNTGSTLSLASPVGSLRMTGGQITGGTVQQSAGNTLLLSSSSGNTLNGVTVRGSLTVGDVANTSGRVRISNGLVVQTEGGDAPGVVNVGTVAGATGAILGFTGTQTFDNGTINLGSASQSGNVSLDGAGTFTLGASGIVRGSGSFGQARFVGGTANIVNAGTISADLSGRTLLLNNSGTLDNAGLIEARNGGTLNVTSNVVQHAGNTLTGGTWRVSGGGILNLNETGAVNITTNQGDVTLDGATASFARINALTNNQGAFRLLGARNFTAAGAFTNSGLLQLAGGTFAAPGLSNTASGEIFGFGSVTPTVLNSGLVRAAGGTLLLTGGIDGQSGTLQSDAGATLALGANSDGDFLVNNGSLALGAFNVTVDEDYTNANFGAGNAFNARANVSGTGQILASGDVAQALTGDVTGGTGATPQIAFGNLHVGDVVNRQFQVANTGTAGPSLRGAVQTSVNGGNLTDVRLSGSGVTAGNFGPVAAGTASSDFTVTFSGSSAGALAGQSVALVNNFDNVAEQVLGISGAVYRYASPSAHLPEPVVFGNSRVGDVVSQALTLTNNVAADGFSESLDASIGAATAGVTTNGGSISLLAAGATNNTNLVVGLDTSSAGAKVGTATLSLASNGAGTSELGVSSLGTQTVNVSGDVYRLASAGAHSPEPVVFANRHVGDAATQALSLSNTAVNDGFSERLNASIGSATGDATSNGGSFNLLGAGATNSTSLVVGIDTSSAGAKSGTATISLASDGAGTSGFTALNLGTQTVNVSGDVYRLAAANTITAVQFGNVHIGDVVSQALSLTNLAANDGFSERLNASFESVSDARILATGSVTQLAAGASNTSNLVIALDTSTAGSLTGFASVRLTSDGTGTSGLGLSDLGVQNVGVTTNVAVYRFAEGLVGNAQPIDLGAYRVGDASGSVGLSVSNVAANDGFSERLNAAAGTTAAGFTATGSFSGLAAGATDNSSIAVGIDTTTAGAKSGTTTVEFVSNGAGTSGLGTTAAGAQNVALQGRVYAQAVANVQTAAVNFGIVHVGDSVAAQSITVSNDATGALTDTLRGSVNGVAPGFIGSGTLGAAGLMAGASSTALQIGLDTTTAGVFNGAASLAFASHNAELADFDLGLTNVLLSGQVNNYANPVLTQSGFGTFIANGSNFTLDFGPLVQGTSTLVSLLQLTNLVTGPADELGATYDFSTGPFALGGFSDFTGLAAGGSQSLTVSFDALTAGVFEQVVGINLFGENASGFQGNLGTFQLTLRADVAPVPVPAAVWLFATGLAGMWRARRSPAGAG